MHDFENFELVVKGCIIGHLIGDALGYPYENLENTAQYQIEMVRGKHEEVEGSWSAPGAFSLATMCSINEMEGLDIYDLMEKFNDVYIAGYLCPGEECRDIGPISTQAIKNFTNGMPPDKCGVTIEPSDNESLSRILPIGLYFAAGSIDELIKNVHYVCRLTHANVLSEVTCSLYCIIIRNLLLQRAEKATELLNDYYLTMNMKNHADALKIVIDSKRIKPTGSKHVADSFWSAWQCYSKNEQDYECCLADAVHLGNDTNATAAISGSLSGLSNGLNNIPYRWLQTLKLDSEAMDIIQTFVNSVITKISDMQQE